jgi:hypothetical protein
MILSQFYISHNILITFKRSNFTYSTVATDDDDDDDDYEVMVTQNLDFHERSY